MTKTSDKSDRDLLALGDDDEYRLELIRDSLIGVSYHLPDPEVLLFPSLDNFLLLHQAPLIFAFWRNGKCVYHTLRDPDYLSQHRLIWRQVGSDWRIPLPGTKYAISVHDFSTPEQAVRDSTGKKQVALPVDRKATQITRALFYKSGRSSLSGNFLYALSKSIDRRLEIEASETIRPDNTEEPMSHLRLEYSEIRDFLKPMRAVLDSILDDSFRSGYLNIKVSDSLMIPNIFAVVRTCPRPSLRYGAFNYTANLMLPSRTQEAIRTWYSTQGSENGGPPRFSKADDLLAALEQPLGSKSRSVSDLVFSSGIVNFGRRASEAGWDASVAGDERDDARRAAEQLIYPPGWRLFYIPIHVGGTPWLALFTFTPEDPSSNFGAWHHNYSFYRDLVQKTAALIRQAIHDVYAELISKMLVSHMRSWLTPLETLVQQIRRDAQKIAQVYPFPMLELEVRSGSDPSKNQFFVPGRGCFSASFKKNPFFTRQVTWNLGDEKLIFDKCEKAIGNFTNLENSIAINTIAQTSHLIKVPLRILDSIAASSNPLREQHMRRQIRKILDLHDAAAALVSEEKRTRFRRVHRKAGEIGSLAQLVSEKYESALDYLKDPSVSGNIAPSMASLVTTNSIVYSDHCSHSACLQGVHLVFYEHLLSALVDGLLTNAVESVNSSAPRIEVRLTLEGTSAVYLEVENSTSIEPQKLSDILRNLNSPGPDMVGISGIHWISRACWPHVSDESRLIWSYQPRPPLVVARARIAEVEL